MYYGKQQWAGSCPIGSAVNDFWPGRNDNATCISDYKCRTVHEGDIHILVLIGLLY